MQMHFIRLFIFLKKYIPYMIVSITIRKNCDHMLKKTQLTVIAATRNN